MLTTGTILQNRYRIVSLLGQGGMGAVYRAWHMTLNMPLAIKEMAPQPGLDAATLSQLRQQFQQEAAVLAHLSHPNLVRVIDHFEEGGSVYMVMDFVNEVRPAAKRRRVSVWVWVLGGAAVVILCAGLALCVLGGGLLMLAPARVLTEAPTRRPTRLPASVPTTEPEKPGVACAPGCTYEDMVVGFIQTGSYGGGTWRDANMASFKETAEALGITLKFYDAQNDLAKQVAAFHQFNRDPEVNVIILAALETTGWEAVLQEAKDAGKVVVLEDRRIDAPEDLYATYIGSDFVEEGRKAADEMCKLLEGSEKKNVWELVGNVGSSAAKDRGQGFRERMGECGIEIVKSQTGNWSFTEGKYVTEAWLEETQDVQGVFAQNDEMGLGAIEAIKEAGLKPGVDVKIVSIDATAGAFRAMLTGELNVTVECNPLLAPQVYEAALKALNGEELPKWIPSQEGVFRSDMPDLEEIVDGRRY